MKTSNLLLLAAVVWWLTLPKREIIQAAGKALSGSGTGSGFAPPASMRVSELGKDYKSSLAKFKGIYDCVDGIGTCDTLLAQLKTLTPIEKAYLNKRYAHQIFDGTSWTPTSMSLLAHIEDDFGIFSCEEFKQVQAVLPGIDTGWC
tara:strand:+ start:2503 stop:2940 length:438 start_codon:yes stop_codon:yes gene_type:complete